MFVTVDPWGTWPSWNWPRPQIEIFQGIRFVEERPRWPALDLFKEAVELYRKSRLPLVLLLAELDALVRRRRAAFSVRIMQIVCTAWWLRRARRRAVRHGPVLLNFCKMRA